MILLNLFCPECTLWLVLMLAGAWILGWIFWMLLMGSGYRTTIKDLETELEETKKKNTSMKSELTDQKYKLDKREEEYKDLRYKFNDLDLKYKVRGEELAKIKADYDALKPPPE